MTNTRIIGMDEVGRGAWAGPLVVCAVGFNKEYVNFDKLPWKGDSKKINKKYRKELASFIRDHSSFIRLGSASNHEIDKLGLSKALQLAYERASIGVDHNSKIIIDGNINFLDNKNSQCVIKADYSIPEVSAASIVAKVARDEAMEYLSYRYSNYGFEKNVGYGTKLHIKNLKEHGPCEIHRKSFKPIKGFARGNS